MVIAAMLVLCGSGLASAQSLAELRWRPYLGCWQLFQENASVQGLQASPGTTICVSPSETGVRVMTFVNNQPLRDEQLIADTAVRPLQEGDCPGARTIEWSREGSRLFTHTTLRCAGQPERIVSSIGLMMRGPVWLDVQSIDEGETHQVRIRRFQRTPSHPAGVPAVSDAMLALAASEGQLASTRPLTVEDVIEAAGKISPLALEALVSAVGGRFNINSRTLTQLADNGVSRDVIDLMVAKSFPDRFRSEQLAMNEPGSYSGGSSVDYGMSSIYMSGDLIVGSRMYPFPVYHDPFYYYYSPFYFSPYYYSLFGHPYYVGPHRYSNYSTFYYGGAGLVPIVPPVIGGPTPLPGDHGYMVNGRGYTRPEGGSISGQPRGSRTTTTPAESSAPSGSGSSGGSTSGSSSSGGGSISGSGSSGGGISSGRTAQPR